LDLNLPPHSVSTITNQHQLPGSIPQQLLQHLQQPPSQLAQMLSQQTQTLQASFQSSQQAFSQLQQQLQLMQPSNQALTSQQSSQASKQQSQWAGIVPQTVASTLATTTATDVHSSKTAPAVPVMAQAVAPVKCNWTEHTSPDGYKYYYNGVTGESRWEKPEELMLLEQQPQQKPLIQQPQAQSHVHPSAQQVRQTQQVQLHAQLQTQLRHQQQLQQQLQQPTLSSSYQASGVTGHQNVQELSYAQLQAVAGSVRDPTRFPQGLQAAQEWMWKNKPAGT